ncbi:MAG: MFS transporter [Bacillota bacterium]
MGRVWSNRNFLTAFIAAVFFYSSLQFLIPVLPKYAMFRGAQPAAIGMIIAAVPIMALVFRLRVGHCVDAQGRKPWLLVGSGMFALAPFMFLMSGTVTGIVFARMWMGLAIAAFTTAGAALCVDLSPPESRGEAVGMFEGSQSLAMVFMPLLGGMADAAWGFTPAFIIAGGLGFVGFLLLTLVTETRCPAARLERGGPSVLSGGVLLATLTYACAAFSFGTMVSYLPLHLGVRGVEQAGLFFSTTAVTLLASRVLGGRIADRLGPAFVIKSSLAMLAWALFLLANVSTLAGLLGIAAVYGWSYGASFPALAAVVAAVTPPDKRGRAFAAFTGSLDVGIAGGALVGGIAARPQNYSNVYLVAAVAAAVGLALFTAGWRGQGSRVSKEGVSSA